MEVVNGSRPSAVITRMNVIGSSMVLCEEGIPPHGVKDEVKEFFSCLTSENLLTSITEDLADPKLEAPSLLSLPSPNTLQVRSRTQDI